MTIKGWPGRFENGGAASDPDVITLGKELLIGVNWKAEIDQEDRFSRLAFKRWLRRA